jgi:hypothetical protein
MQMQMQMEASENTMEMQFKMRPFLVWMLPCLFWLACQPRDPLANSRRLMTIN